MSRPFYVIAHKVDQLSNIVTAVNRGANAIECGPLHSLTVSHDGAGMSDDWHLGWVKVESPNETIRYIFKTWITEERSTTRLNGEIL